MCWPREILCIRHPVMARTLRGWVSMATQLGCLKLPSTCGMPKSRITTTHARCSRPSRDISLPLCGGGARSWALGMPPTRAHEGALLFSTFGRRAMLPGRFRPTCYQRLDVERKQTNKPKIIRVHLDLDSHCQAACFALRPCMCLKHDLPVFCVFCKRHEPILIDVHGTFLVTHVLR